MTSQTRVLVAGGGLGIGAWVTQYLISKFNAKVLVLSLDISEEVARLEAEGKIFVIRGDATDEAIREQTWAAMLHTLGGLDALVVTMGLMGEIETIANMDLARMRHVFDVNLFTPIELCQKYLPMLRQSQGRLIILSSVADREATFSGWGSYCSSKAALTRFSELLGHEEDEVEVYGIYPGLTRTPMVSDLVAGKFKGKMKDFEVEEFKRRNREGEVEPPEWSANVIAKLAVGAIKGEGKGRVSWYYKLDPKYKD